MTAVLLAGWPILVPYALFFVVAGGSLAGFMLMQRRLKELEVQLASAGQEMRSATATWASSLTAVGKQVESIEESNRHPSNGSDANAATRRKVLKLHRMGNSIDHIAGALRLSKGEVDLMLKIHNIILQPQEPLAGNRRSLALEQKV